jgi:hypothetical protein
MHNKFKQKEDVYDLALIIIRLSVYLTSKL